VQIRRALVNEPNLPVDVLNVLVTDANGPVSVKARRRLDEIAAATAPQQGRPYGEVILELPMSPRRAHRATTATTAQPALTAAPRPSVWDQ